MKTAVSYFTQFLIPNFDSFGRVALIIAFSLYKNALNFEIKVFKKWKFKNGNFDDLQNYSFRLPFNGYRIG